MDRKEEIIFNIAHDHAVSDNIEWAAKKTFEDFQKEKETLDEDNKLWLTTCLKAMDQYVQPYKEIAELISEIYHYGNFKAETANERKLEARLRQVDLWPTNEEEIIERHKSQSPPSTK